MFILYLIQDIGDDAGANGQTTLANSETAALFQGDRCNQLHLQVTLYRQA